MHIIPNIIRMYIFLDNYTRPGLQFKMSSLIRLMLLARWISPPANIYPNQILYQLEKHPALLHEQEDNVKHQYKL